MPHLPTPADEAAHEHAQHTPELAAIQTRNGSGGEGLVVDRPATVGFEKRFQNQNKAIERLLKDPANEKSRKAFHRRNNSLTVFGSPGYYSGMDDPLAADPAAATAHHIVRRLEGETIRGDRWTKGAAASEARKLDWGDLYRAYKHTPHQPASVFLKYLVHRLNNLDAYDDPAEGVAQDISFLEHHQVGKAAEKNGHLNVADLHGWMKLHPDLPKQLLAHQAQLHNELRRGVGLNIRDINGQPYIALTRGLNSDIMDHEHALSSWSDLQATGFGKVMNHAWVPLKDLWYSYQYGPEDAGGEAGHENEYLVSHSAPRYEAHPEDVRGVVGHHNPMYYDNATDDELATVAPTDPSALVHPGAGPKTLAAVQGSIPPETAQHYIVMSKLTPREVALASPLENATRNPNLTTEDLAQKTMSLSSQNALDEARAHFLLKHPNATAETARTILSQYAPGRDHILSAVAESPLAPPDVLDGILKHYDEVAPTWQPSIRKGILRNRAHTSAQADILARKGLEQPTPPTEDFLNGRYSAQLINELSDEVGKGFGKEPLHTAYLQGTNSPHYKTDLDKFLAAKKRFNTVYGALSHMGGDRDLDDDANEALIEAATRHKMDDALKMMVARQNYAPLSELTQLRLLRGLDELPGTEDQKATDRIEYAESKGLAPMTVHALAIDRDSRVRSALYHNKTVDPEAIAEVWPKDRPWPTHEQMVHLGYGLVDPEDIYEHLAGAIQERRDYAARRAEDHLIRPWPKGLAKGETDWWPVRLREWMSSREKAQRGRGYYYRAESLGEAQAVAAGAIVPVTPTDEVLDGYVVFAYPATDHNYHAWESDPEAGQALVYFETDEEPIRHDSRVYWPHEVVASDARVAAIRPQNQQLQKAEQLTRGPAFNGEKDYRPDESGDPRFPFMGGPKKERSEEEHDFVIPGTGLEPGEHRTALAQLGHNDRFDLVLAAACFLARKRYDEDKFQQGLVVYGDEARAALHAVDLSDSEKNLRALAAIIKLQHGEAKPLRKSEPQPIGIHSVQPGNEDAVDAAESVARAAHTGSVIALKLSGKHSKGAMAAKDPQTGRVWLLKPPGGKQSPAAGARDGTVSQPRREACFWHIADQLHLGGVIPRADLIILNAQEWSAIKLLGSDWRSLDERNREKQYKGREVLGPYLADGQLHRWAILDWVLGNTDSHGQNLLVNNGGSVALIDHGAAFAGPRFDPAHDTKSFIPFYLRVWAPSADFKKMAPEDRIKNMPALSDYDDRVLKTWLVQDFTPQMVEREARKYGIDEKVLAAVLERLQTLRSAPGNLSRTINALWAGTQAPKPDVLG